MLKCTSSWQGKPAGHINQLFVNSAPDGAVSTKTAQWGSTVSPPGNNPLQNGFGGGQKTALDTRKAVKKSGQKMKILREV